MSIIDTVYNAIVSDIKNDTVHVGDKLPTEQKLCAKFNVGRSTIREAMRMLHSQGYVQIKRGSGTYVISSDPIENHGAKWILTNEDDMRDYMDLRIAIEVLAVSLLIRRLDDGEYENLRKIEVEFEMAVQKGDVSGMAAMDESFHSTIAKGTKNELLGDVNQLLTTSFRTYRNITFLVAEHRAIAISGHRSILEAIGRRDTNEAAFRIRTHLETSMKNAVAQKSDVLV